MSKYIDADALDKDGWTASRTYSEDNHTMTYEVKKLTDFPTADVRENVKGKWIDEPVYRQTMDGKTWDGYTYCSECREMHEYKYRSRYCPNCGAEMKGEEE